MSKLKLNKKTLSVLDKDQLESVKGGREQQFMSWTSCKRTVDFPFL